MLTSLDATSALAASVAGLGAILGARYWRLLCSSRRWAVSFLVVSALSAVVADSLRVSGHANAWVGNLWQLSVVGLLLPGVVQAVPGQDRVIYRSIQRGLVLTWVIYFILLRHLFEFTTLFHASACIAVVFASLSMLYSLCFTEPSLPRSPAFLLGVGAALACAFDVIPHSGFIEWSLKGESLFIATWVVRNVAWAAGYLVMTYSVYVEGRYGC